MTRHAAHLDEVRTYYDRNTPRFATHHQSAVADAVHRAVWGPGVATREEAFRYVNRRIGEVVDEQVERVGASADAPLPVLDLGCGVGGSLFDLARRAPIRGTGITLSPVQVEVAERKAAAHGLAGRCRFLLADYLELPPLEPHPVVYAVESFVHGPDPAAFFRSAASVLPAGGRLVVCDDFLTARGAAADAADERSTRRARQHLADFRRGWILGSLVSAGRAEELARSAGLIKTTDDDLTPHLELRRPIDRLIAAVVPLGRHLPLDSPWWRSWLGGHALQVCLLEGLVAYRFLVFEKA